MRTVVTKQATPFPAMIWTRLMGAILSRMSVPRDLSVTSETAKVATQPRMPQMIA